MENAKDKLQWLEYDLLEPYSHVAHGVFTRHGGLSEEPFASLNVSMSVGDHPDSVKVNREKISKALEVEHLVIPHLTHGIEVSRVTLDNIGQVHQADALFTTEKGVGIGVTHADCQAAFFYDPTHEAIAVAHAGWRGSVQNIYANVVETMKRELGTKAADLIVCISPSLGPDHAEFKDYKKELPEEFWAFQKTPHFFNFWEISKMQLTACGVSAQKIEIAGICSFCREKDYFSHRREKKTGRNASVIALS
jgi:YfiH family protein